MQVIKKPMHNVVTRPKIAIVTDAPRKQRANPATTSIIPIIIDSNLVKLLSYRLDIA